jgi:hydroxyethylthiazole kinase-like uncharacterized protein yjeF
MALQRVSGTPHAWPLHGVAATRALEQRALAASPPHTLMRRAGLAVARLALAVAPHAERVWVAAGPGNNGGDGLEAALHLHALGRRVVVTLVAGEPRPGSDAADGLARARAAGVPFGGAPPEAPQLVIDALLGLGAARAPQGALAAAIEAINAADAPVLAVDLPSGLDGDRGRPFGAACVRAAHTLALLTGKPGLHTAAGRDAAGTVWLDTLGIDDAAAPDAWLGSAPARAPRTHASHKGRYGDVLVIGGACGMTGAAWLAGTAALAAGAGRVYVAPLDATAATPPRAELMLRPLADALAPAQLGSATVVCGCGGGDAVGDVLDAVFARAGTLVLDADALNAVARDASLRARLRVRGAHARATVLTPHPLEAARLLGSDAATVQADRLFAAQRLADEFGAVVLLKGSGSVIAAPAWVPQINPTGNAALASAGTGDVLAGWIGGAWAVSADNRLEAARVAAVESAWRHGAAADAAGAYRPLRAADLVEAMHRGG